MLATEQREALERDGITRLPGAIPAADVERMRVMIWDRLVTEHGIRPDAPQTWTIERPQGFRDVRRLAPFTHTATGGVGVAFDTLFGAGCWEPGAYWRPFVTFAVAGVSWRLPWGGWHYDTPFAPAELAASDGPPAVNAFAVLAPLAPRGGGTLILAGSHHLIRRLTPRLSDGDGVRSRVMKRALGDLHPWLAGLWGDANADDVPDAGTDAASDAEEARCRRYLDEGAVVDGVPLRVVEVTGSPGDVVLMNALCLHDSGPNERPEPRLMAIQQLVRPVNSPNRNP